MLDLLTVTTAAAPEIGKLTSSECLHFLREKKQRKWHVVLEKEEESKQENGRSNKKKQNKRDRWKQRRLTNLLKGKQRRPESKQKRLRNQRRRLTRPRRWHRLRRHKKRAGAKRQADSGTSENIPTVGRVLFARF